MSEEKLKMEIKDMEILIDRAIKKVKSRKMFKGFFYNPWIGFSLKPEVEREIRRLEAQKNDS